MQILLQIGLGLLGVALIFFVKIVKFNKLLKVGEIWSRYAKTVILTTIGVVLFTILVNVAPDCVSILQKIGLNLELPTGGLNNASFIMLGITLFYFVDDGQGVKDDPNTSPKV